MTTQRDYIEYKIKKAEDSLKAAEILFENRLPKESVSKLYYAVFNAASALLTKLKLNPKTHQGTKILFHKEYIYSGIVDLGLGKLYDNLMAKRFEADYESFALIDENDIPDYIKGVRLFIEEATKIVFENN